MNDTDLPDSPGELEAALDEALWEDPVLNALYNKELHREREETPREYRERVPDLSLEGKVRVLKRAVVCLVRQKKELKEKLFQQRTQQKTQVLLDSDIMNTT